MEFFNRNNLLLGLIIGIISPIIGLGIVYVIFELLVSSGIMDPASTSASSRRLRTMLIIAICTNILWIKKFNQPFTAQTLRGVIFGTMLYCIAWFIKYYDTLYAED